MEIWRHGNIDKEFRHLKKIKQKTEVQAIFLNLFTICSSCKRKIVICQFVHEQTTEFIRLQTE